MISPHEMPLQFNCVGVKMNQRTKYSFNTNEIDEIINSIAFIDVVIM